MAGHSFEYINLICYQMVDVFLPDMAFNIFLKETKGFHGTRVGEANEGDDNVRSCIERSLPLRSAALQKEGHTRQTSGNL